MILFPESITQGYFQKRESRIPCNMHTVRHVNLHDNLTDLTRSHDDG